MNGEGAADETDRGGARAKPVERSLARSHDRRLIGEPEVIVGRQDDDLAPILHANAGRLRAFEIVETFVGAVLDELLQLGLDSLFQRVGHEPISRITLPAWPSLITWMASLMHSSGNRWVITGRGSS